MKFDIDSSSDWAAMLYGLLPESISYLASCSGMTLEQSWYGGIASGSGLVGLASLISVDSKLLRFAACNCVRLYECENLPSSALAAIGVAELHAAGRAPAEWLPALQNAAMTDSGSIDDPCRRYAVLGASWCCAEPRFLELAPHCIESCLARSIGDLDARKTTAAAVRARIPFDVIAKCATEKAGAL